MRSKIALSNLSPGQTVQEAWERGDLQWLRQAHALIETVLIYPKRPGDQKMRFRQWVFNLSAWTSAGKRDLESLLF